MQTGGYDELIARVSPFVDAIVLNGVYEVVVKETPRG